MRGVPLYNRVIATWDGVFCMEAYIYLELDLFAVVLLLLMVGIHNRRDVQSIEQRLFNMVLLLTAATIFFDAFQWFFDGREGTGAAEVTFSYLYFIPNTLVPYAWLIYCDFKILGSVSGLKRRMWMYFVPTFVSIGMVAVNGWTRGVFYFDAANHYLRGNLFPLYAVLTYLPVLFSAVLTARHLYHERMDAQRRELKFLLYFMVLPSICFIVQTLYYGLPLVFIAATVSMFMIYIKVQNRRIYMDELTGISNRRQLAREFSRRNDAPDSMRRIYAIMIDADDFKKVNDQYGHAAGDQLLVRAARLLERLCAPCDDYLARMGGDEFLILATRRADEPFLLLQEIQEAIAAFNEGEISAERTLSLSCGAAVFGKDGVDTLDTLLSAADRAMYRNKAMKKAARGV